MGSHGAVVILDHLMWTGLTDIHLGSMLSGYLNCLCNGTWVFSFGTMGWPKICWSLLCHWEFCSAHHWNHITRIIFRNACYLYQRDLKPLALVKCQNTGFNFTVKKSYCGATRTLSPMVIHDPYVWVRPGSIPGWCSICSFLQKSYWGARGSHGAIHFTSPLLGYLKLFPLVQRVGKIYNWSLSCHLNMFAQLINASCRVNVMHVPFRSFTINLSWFAIHVDFCIYFIWFVI